MATRTKHFNAAFQAKEVGDDGKLKGYASVFGVVDSYREVVMPGAFAASLERHKSEGDMPAMLWQHSSFAPIGVWTKMEEDAKGLVCEGQLCLDTRLGSEARALLKMGALRGLSIGFSVNVEEFDRNNKVTRLKEVDLWETSVVTFPANREAMVEEVRSAVVGEILASKKSLEAFLRDAGLPNSVAKKMAALYLKGDPRDEGDPDGDPGDPRDEGEMVVKQQSLERLIAAIANSP